MKKINIFVSYSHKNSKEFAEVSDVLQSIKGSIGIKCWDDTQLVVGDKWDEKIKEYLTKADIGVLLITTSFLNSKYVNKIEVKRLLQQCNAGKTKMFIVILRQCNWGEVKWLEKYELFNKGTPIWGKSGKKTERESHLVKLSGELKKVVKAIQKTKSNPENVEDLEEKGETSTLSNRDLPFANQINLKNVLKPDASSDQTTFTYAAVTGLAGQGKSYLLRELKKIYSDAEWNCGYAEFDPKKSLNTLVKELLISLDVPVKETRSNSNLGSLFYNSYIQKAGWKKPLVLLIDTLGSVTQKDVISLDKNFIEDLDQWVTKNEFYSVSGRFRLILAGRNLSSNLIQRSNKYKDLKLSPFRYKDVHGMLNDYFAHFSFEPTIISDFAADLLYLSGGHPGLMYKIVKKFNEEEKTPQAFFDFYVKNHWENDLSNTMSDVSEGIFHQNKKIKELAEKTVSFRYFNRSILGKLYVGQSPEIVISKIVNPSGLYTGDNPDYPNLFSDGLLRDIHSLCMLANNPEKFRVKCIESRNLCWGEIASSINAREFLTEYLFQCLQESIAESKNKIHSRRKKIQISFEKKMKDFFVKLSKIQNSKSRKNDYPRQLIIDLKNYANLYELDKNRALFRFWIVYLYKDKYYNDDVYNNFVSFTERLIKKHFGRS